MKKLCLLIPIFIVTFLLLFTIFTPNSVQAKGKQLSLSVPTKQVALNHTVYIKIKKKPAKSKVTFSCNKPAIAKISKKSGKITPKKTGTIVIIAKAIKKGKIIAKKQVKLKIVDKSSTLPNVTFTLDKIVNPFSLSITLHSSRILLTHEVQASTIMLSSAKNSRKYSMQFSSISQDGKHVTFQANPSDAKRLCPGNSTSDGTYYVTSNLFSNKLQTTYKERFSNQSLRGFVLDDKGEFLSNAVISLIDSSTHDIVSKTYSNQYGYYEFSIDPKKKYSLLATKLNFSSKQINHVTNASGSIALPIILKSLNAPTSIGILLSTEKGQPIDNHEVKIYDKNDKFLFSGRTNKNGAINFSSTKKKQGLYTKILSANPEEPRFLSEDYPLELQNNDITDLYIPTNEPLKVVVENKDLYQGQKITFSFNSCINNQLVISAQLEPFHTLTTENINLSWENLSEYNKCSTLQIGLYSKSGNSVFEYSCAAPKNTAKKMSLLSTTFPVFLTNSSIFVNDGDYYLCIKALDINKNIISVPIIDHIKISNHKIPASSFFFTTPYMAKTLLYSNTPTTFPAAIKLYEKVDQQYFYISSFSITPSSQKPNQVASCFLCNLKESGNYYVATESGSITNSTFQTNKDKVVTAISDTTLPSFQFTYSDSTALNNETNDNKLSNSENPFQIPCKEIEIEEDDFFLSSTYPNTVYAFYTKSGSPYYCLFTTSAFSSVDQRWPSHNSSYIYDKLTYKKSPVTSQSHYTDTPFFVI